MGPTRQSVRQTTEALAADGLIRFENNPRHRRAKLLRPTQAGRSTLELTNTAWVDQLALELAPSATRHAPRARYFNRPATETNRLSPGSTAGSSSTGTDESDLTGHEWLTIGSGHWGGGWWPPMTLNAGASSVRRRLRVNGIELSYLVDGVETGQPVVLVHGGSLDAGSWSTVIESLRDEYLTCAFDLRGHGSSDRPGDYGFELLAADVSGVVRELGLSDVILVGHSLGAGAAMLAAQRRPEWLAALVLEEPTVLRPGRTRPEPGPDPGPAPAGYDRAGFMATLVPQYYDPAPAWWDDLAVIDVPTLYLVGRTDHDQTKDDRAAAELIPDCRYVTVPVGHHIHRDAGDEYLKHLRRLLRVVSRRRNPGSAS